VKRTRIKSGSLVALLILSLSSCTNSIQPITSIVQEKTNVQDFDNLTDINDLMLGFNLKSLPHSYILTRVNKWLNENNSAKLLRELEIAWGLDGVMDSDDLLVYDLKGAILSASSPDTLYNSIIAIQAVIDKRAIDHDFNAFILSLDPTPTPVGQFTVGQSSRGFIYELSTAMAYDGSFVVAWSETYSSPDLNTRIYARRFNADGTPNGDKFRVDTYNGPFLNADTKSSPSVAISDNGSFVITWGSRGQDGDGMNESNSYAQRYNADGSPNGGEFRVNSYTTASQSGSSVGMDSNGNFIITWTSNQNAASNNDVYAQRYNSDGTLNGSEFLVNSYTTNNQGSSLISMNDDGKFIISWASYGQDGSGSGVYAQRYNTDGSVNGSEFKVNTYTTQNQDTPSIAMNDDGKFVITWRSNGQDGDSVYENNDYAQRFNADGTKNGSEFRVNTYTTGHQGRASVAISNSGNFVISWIKTYSYPYYLSAQKYDSNGNTIGSEFQISDHTNSGLSSPKPAMSDNGNFVITWSEGLIYAKRYDRDGNVK